MTDNNRRHYAVHGINIETADDKRTLTIGIDLDTSNNFYYFILN